MMMKILIFAGTTEGRQIADYLSHKGIFCTVCVATPYGTEMLTPSSCLEILEGRLDREAMSRLMREGGYQAVIDATHPYATIVSEEVKGACEAVTLPYLRLSRTVDGEAAMTEERCVMVSSAEEAGRFLAETEGTILLTTGSKELPILTACIGNNDRLYARILPLADSLAIASEVGLKGRQILAMQGPFDTAMNEAMLRYTKAAWLVTKETGRAGGFEEKLEAAAACGVKTVIIRNPERGKNDALTFDGVLEALADLPGDPFGLSDAHHGDTPKETEGPIVTLVGIGTGQMGMMTAAVREAISGADIIFGAARMIESLDFAAGVKVPVYQSDKILAYLAAHPDYRRVVAAFSGDTGFYSGASSMLAAIRRERPEMRVTILPGISALSYMASRMGRPWQNMKILSVHGRDCHVISQVRRHETSYFIVSGLSDVKAIGEKLTDAEKKGVVGDISVTVGYQLSYPEEMIRIMKPSELSLLKNDGLYVLVIDNPQAAACPVVPGISDEAFLRDKVPMTKEEVRSLSLCKLQLTARSVVYDIGAGSGSVSVEIARQCPEGHVYAIEQKGTALALLEKNRDHFAVDNMTIIEGCAPEGLEALPMPTHVFIGGSDGHLREILSCVLKRNPSVRLVINTVTLETLSEAQVVLASFGLETEYIQVQISRAKKLGRYHLMKALNPVFIITAQKTA